MHTHTHTHTKALQRFFKLFTPIAACMHAQHTVPVVCWNTIAAEPSVMNRQKENVSPLQYFLECEYYYMRQYVATSMPYHKSMRMNSCSIHIR